MHLAVQPLAAPLRQRACSALRCRQLSRTQVDLASIERIFITHMHGDHCFGLAQMLAALDGAKRRGTTPPEAQSNHVYGPPGTVELLQASLVLTSLHKQLQVGVGAAAAAWLPSCPCWCWWWACFGCW
jgi:ribonuclease BN (tRNA processing enzyme)